jgi:hypothetical protein
MLAPHLPDTDTRELFSIDTLYLFKHHLKGEHDDITQQVHYERLSPSNTTKHSSLSHPLMTTSSSSSLPSSIYGVLSDPNDTLSTSFMLFCKRPDKALPELWTPVLIFFHFLLCVYITTELDCSRVDFRSLEAPILGI